MLSVPQHFIYSSLLSLHTVTSTFSPDITHFYYLASPIFFDISDINKYIYSHLPKVFMRLTCIHQTIKLVEKISGKKTADTGEFPQIRAN